MKEAAQKLFSQSKVWLSLSLLYRILFLIISASSENLNYCFIVQGGVKDFTNLVTCSSIRLCQMLLSRSWTELMLNAIWVLAGEFTSIASEHGLWIHGFRPTSLCLIIEVLATRAAKFLQPSGNATMINNVFTFNTTNVVFFISATL